MKEIKLKDVADGIKDVFRREAHAYNDVWNMLTLRAKQLLEALAIDPTPKIYSKDFLNRHNFNSPSTIQRALKYLEREEIIERENETYMFTPLDSKHLTGFTDIFSKLWIINFITHSA